MQVITCTHAGVAIHNPAICFIQFCWLWFGSDGTNAAMSQTNKAKRDATWMSTMHDFFYSKSALQMFNDEGNALYTFVPQGENHLDVNRTFAWVSQTLKHMMTKPALPLLCLSACCPTHTTSLGRCCNYQIYCSTPVATCPTTALIAKT